MIDDLQTWKDELEALPKVADNSWALTFANWYYDRIINIEPDATALVPVGFSFTFPVAIFAAQLIALTPTDNALAGISGFADAWEVALNASVVVVGPGSFVPPASPATTFSAVTTTIIDPVSIAAGKAKILELVSAPPVADAQDSEFPVKFRDATLLLTITATGLNNVTPTPGPLVAALVPLN